MLSRKIISLVCTSGIFTLSFLQNNELEHENRSKKKNSTLFFHHTEKISSKNVFFSIIRIIHFNAQSHFHREKISFFRVAHPTHFLSNSRINVPPLRQPQSISSYRLFRKAKNTKKFSFTSEKTCNTFSS